MVAGARAIPVTSRPEIQSIQIMRVVASLCLVVYHATLAAHAYTGPVPAFVDAIVSRFSISVDAFFVISGFVIYYVNADRCEADGWLTGYARARLLRVYVPYLPMGLALAATYTLLPQLRGTGHDWTWFSTVTLLPSSGLPALLPAWTLQHEIMFYTLMGGLFALNRVALGLAIWGLAILALNLPNGPGSNPLFATISLDFIFGVTAAWAVMRTRIGYGPLIGIGIAGTAAHILAGTPHYSPLAGLGLAGFIAAIAKAEIERRITLKPGRFMAPLIAACYSIYLVHLPMISAVARIAHWASIGWLPTLALATGLSVPVGLLYYAHCERPLLSWARSATGKRRPIMPQGSPSP